jgi:hypothetical protein
MTRRYTTAIVVAFLLFGASYPTRRIQRADNGEMLWSSDKAIIFIDTMKLGFEESVGRFLLILFFAQLGVVPDHIARALYVWEVTEKTVEQHVLPGIHGTPFRGVNGRVVSGGWEWKDHAMVARSAADAQSTYPLERRGDYSNVAGWSKRSIFSGVPNEETTVDFALNSRPFSLIVRTPRSGVTTIDLRNDRDGSKRLWTLDRRTRWLGRDDYSKAFGLSR